jgi:hypothetical protein
MRGNKTVTLSFLVLGLTVRTASAQVQQDVLPFWAYDDSVF